MFYRSTKNTRLAEQVAATFTAALKDLHKPIYQMTPEFLSAFFLLSSDNKLWNRAKYSYIVNRIDFEKINMRGIDPDGYTLCKTAQDLYEATRHIDFSDLGNSGVINNKVYSLIKSALAIRRDGCCALKLNMKGDIEL